jgi:hypothetical protein
VIEIVEVCGGKSEVAVGPVGEQKHKLSEAKINYGK